MSKRKDRLTTTADVPFAPPDWPAARGTIMVKVAAITAHPKNPRTHPDAQIDNLGAAYDEFGVAVPLIVDENFRLVAGAGRWLAAKKKGIEELPCIVVRGWSEKKKIRFMISENRLSENGGYDDELYRSVLAQIKDDELPLGALGFDDATLAELLAMPNEGLSDPEAVPEPPKKPVVRRGDLWLLGEHRLLCGDSTNADDVAKALGGGGKPHLLVSDPPYGVDYDPDWRNRADRANGKPDGARAIGLVKNDGRSDWTEAWALFSGDVAYCWHAGLHASSTQSAFESCGFQLRAQIIWSKSNFAIGRGDYHVKHEPAYYFVRKGKRGHWNGDRKQTTVWDIPKPSKSETGHSTQKPIECMKRPIENNSRKGEAIYEPFSGSGTTIIACEMTGRKAIAIEIDASYVQVAIERWQTFTGKLATLDGKTLEQVAKARRTGRAKADEPAKGKPASVRSTRRRAGLSAAGVAPAAES